MNNPRFLSYYFCFPISSFSGKRFLILFLFLLIHGHFLSSQVVTIYPAKDALIENVNSTSNFGASTSFAAERDESASNLIIRSLIEFDLSAIPRGATIISATLTLSGVDHIYDMDETDSYLERIDQAWSEGTVTWANQPSLSASLSPVLIDDVFLSTTQNCTLDVKSQVQQMLDNPSTNYGFMMKLDNEASENARLGFASSDHGDTAKHPFLVINYEMERFPRLKKELDGSYFIAYDGQLRFSFEENYQPGTLKYHIYDDFHNVVLDDGDYALPKQYGSNWFFINLNTEGDFTTGNYYVLEVYDENGRSSFLRFQKAATDNQTTTTVNSSPIHHFTGQTHE